MLTLVPFLEQKTLCEALLVTYIRRLCHFYELRIIHLEFPLYILSSQNHSFLHS